MSMHYSASKKGFYSPDIHGENMPEDAVELSDEEYQELLDGQSAGEQIQTGDDGRPVLRDLPLPSLELLRTRKAGEIRTAFANAVAAAVNAHGHDWNGGMNSALAIDGAVRLAQLSGATEIELFDIDNIGHTVDITTGQQIAAAIAIDYQTLFAKKQQLLRAIADANADALAAITWEND